MITFNIVYITGSVKYLVNYVHTLLVHTPYKFCMVSNGCTNEENLMLLTLSLKHSERLSLITIPTATSWPHGAVLNYLQARSREPYFCFMDSDIFATADATDVLAPMVAHHISAVFSSMPLWVKDNETTMQRDFNEMIGTFNKTWSGMCIGGTYFAVYNSQHLKDVTSTYAVGFDDYYFEELPAEVQKILKREGLEMKLYDTGKIINALLNTRHYKLQNISQPQLCHIGGVSMEIGNSLVRQKSLKCLIRRIGVFRRLIERVRQIKQKKTLNRRYSSDEEYQINVNQRILHRDCIRKYFLKLHMALVNHQSIPSQPLIRDQEIKQKFEIAITQYINFFRSFYGC